MNSDVLDERKRTLNEAAAEARRYASHYEQGTDGRNTFTLLAEHFERKASESPALALPASGERNAVVEAAVQCAMNAAGLHVTTELVHGLRPGDPEREFWRGFAAAKEEIATALLALKETPNA